MSLTKANLIDSVYNELDFQKQKSVSAIESLLEIIKQTLESGEEPVSANAKDESASGGANRHVGRWLWSRRPEPEG